MYPTGEFVLPLSGIVWLFAVECSCMSNWLSSVESNSIPYSSFYLRGPNFCNICEVLTSLRILILKLLCYSHMNQQQSMLYTRKTTNGRYLSKSPSRYYCCAFTCSNSKRVMAISCVMPTKQHFSYYT